MENVRKNRYANTLPSKLLFSPAEAKANRDSLVTDGKEHFCPHSVYCAFKMNVSLSVLETKTKHAFPDGLLCAFRMTQGVLRLS